MADLSDETHLGDGIHVAYDGKVIAFRLAREPGQPCLYVEPSMLRLLLQIIRRLGLRNKALAAPPAALSRLASNPPPP